MDDSVKEQERARESRQDRRRGIQAVCSQQSWEVLNDAVKVLSDNFLCRRDVGARRYQTSAVR